MCTRVFVYSDRGAMVQGGWAGFLDADHSDGEGDEDEASEEFQPSSEGDDDDDDSDSDSGGSVVNSSDEDDDVRPLRSPPAALLIWTRTLRSSGIVAGSSMSFCRATRILSRCFVGCPSVTLCTPGERVCGQARRCGLGGARA